MSHDCRTCTHHRVREESHERAWVRWHECDVRGGMANLPSFPFHHTTCAQYAPHGAVPPRSALPLFHGTQPIRVPRRRAVRAIRPIDP